jgi:VanZ family protein
MIRNYLLSVITALIIAYISLAGSDNFDDISFLDIPGVDKIVHGIMYFGLMTVIVFENRFRIKSRMRLFIIAFIPFFYGALMELLQLWFTVSRSGSLLDLLSDALGILLALLLCLLIKPVSRILFK